MVRFEHVLLTRFNVKVDYAPEGRGRDPEWLAHRFELFDRFCYPSVRSQSDPRFRWLVLFDRDTPEPWRQRIARYAECPNFESIFLESFDAGSAPRLMDEWVSPDVDLVVSTRLDNDDAIARDFVATVREYVTGEPRVVNFTQGLVWREGRIYRVRDPGNPFASYVEPRPGCRSVLSVRHKAIRDLAPVIQVDGPPRWLQVIHERNLDNRPRGRRTSTAPLRRFTIAAHPKWTLPARWHDLADFGLKWKRCARRGLGRWWGKLRGRS